MMCLTCGITLRKGARFCAVCGRKTRGVPEASGKAGRTKRSNPLAGEVVRVLLIACVVLLSIPVLMSIGCLALL